MPDSVRKGRGIFVTGTDTGVGKTWVAAALLRGLCAAGWRAVGMKPVAAGIVNGERLNGDVIALEAASNVEAPILDVNPYAFTPAIAPHLSAQAIATTIDLDVIARAYERLAHQADAIVVEGAGGPLTPLSDASDMLDIAARLSLPVLLVVGIRLGCLNHALLSAQAIAARGLEFAGWVSNRIDPAMPAAEANVDTLDRRLPAPRVADLRWLAQPAMTPALPVEALAALGFSR